MGGEAGRLGRQAHRGDQFAGLEHALPLGRVAGQRWKSSSGISRLSCPALRSRRRHRARRAARRNPTGSWRCNARSSPAWREAVSPPSARSQRQGRVCCRRWRCRRNRRSACAAAGYRRPSRRCAAGPRRRTAALRPPPETAGRSCGHGPDRHCAPARRCAGLRRGALDPVEAGHPADVDQVAGAHYAALHQVHAGWCPRPDKPRRATAPAATASASVAGRAYSKLFMPHPSGRVPRVPAALPAPPP